MQLAISRLWTGFLGVDLVLVSAIKFGVVIGTTSSVVITDKKIEDSNAKSIKCFFIGLHSIAVKGGT